MTSPDNGKDLSGLARSIDALFGGRAGAPTAAEEEESVTAVEPEAPPSEVEEVEPDAELAEAAEPPAVPGSLGPVAVPMSLQPAAIPKSLQSGGVSEPSEPTAEPSESTAEPMESEPAAVSSEPDAAETQPVPEPRSGAVDDIVWEPVISQEGPARQPKPDAQVFRVAVETFMQSDPLAREGQGRAIREMAAALREAGSLDALADTVKRLALEKGDPADEACLAMARSLVTPAVASRLAARLASEREEGRRAELITVCRRIGHDMALAVSDALSDTTDRYARRVFMEAMVAMGEDGMDVVQEMMEDSRWFVVRNAVAVLGEVGGPRAIELITTALAHSDARVRKEAILALARIGGEDAGMLVYGMIEDADADVRLAATMAAGELKVERALKPLLGLLENEGDQDVVEGILHALGRLGDPGAVPAIEKRAVSSFFSRPPADVRIAAYRALHKIGTPHARSLLEEAAKDKNTEVRTAVRQLVGEH